VLDAAQTERPVGVTEAETRRYYLAGGGDADAFQSRWKRRLDEIYQTASLLSASQLHTAGGGMQYVVAGRRPRLPL
jgi:hypothetical protein